VRGQFQVAACILDSLVNDGKAKDALVSEFSAAHGAAFTHMNTVAQADDKEELKDNWMTENVAEANVEFITSALGLQ